MRIEKPGLATKTKAVCREPQEQKVPWKIPNNYPEVFAHFCALWLQFDDEDLWN